MRVQNIFRLSPAILKFRRTRAVAQKKLAGDAGVHETRLSAIENCRIIGPANGLVLRIADALTLDDQERQELIQAAAHDRVMREMSRNLPPNRLRLLALCLDASRVLSDQDCVSLEDFVDGLIGPLAILKAAPRRKEAIDA